ncbi:glycoside hydrolase family 3 protein [Gandjariella thermophila]|uniref:beta-N-acetylhexosaminidase n=1 Tax=Gandjariella thermophila TaxID=1931992 RepID=A0A4D4J899_9PSEU|nr:glycoside hydrolase family 3 protein [Gandjariella thermophila]GDY30736.1 beta-N-acetylhexosaminidase [Gandjariella thermophila]
MSTVRSSTHRRFPAVPALLAAACLAGTVGAATPAVAAQTANPEPHTGSLRSDGPVPAAPGGKARPSPAREAAMNGWVAATLHRMSLPEKVGQLFVTYVHGFAADTADPANQREFGVDRPAQVVRRYHLGGVIYFHNSAVNNIANPAQVAGLSNGLQRAALASGSGVPLIIGTDQEEGIVTRIGPPATQFPGGMALGAGRSPEDATEAARITAAELRAMGVNQNFAPDADVNVNPANPVIGVRSFGSDPNLVAGMVAAQVAGYQDGTDPAGTVSSAVKHFPGHGDTDTDSHTGLPMINHDHDTWERIDAPPFRAAIAAGTDTIMSAHIVTPKLDSSGEPATLSPAVLTGLLRGELGYQGVIITDSLQMQGVRTKHPDAEIPVLALLAGADQLLMPANLNVAINSVVDAVHAGRLTERRIDTSVARILRLKWRRGIVAHPLVDENRVGAVVGTADHLAAAARITDRTTTAVRNDAGLLPLRAAPHRVLVAGAGSVTVPALAARVAARGPTTSTAVTGTAPSEQQIAAAVAAARNADLVVALTNGLSGSAAQQDLLRRLVATGRPVVAVAVQNPYDVACIDTEPTWLATYSPTAVAMASLARVLFGEVAPAGRLPVDVPDAGDPSRIRYPFGYGLTW